MNMFHSFADKLSFFTDEANKIDYDICSIDVLHYLLANQLRCYYNDVSIDFYVGKKREVGISNNANATTAIYNHNSKFERVTISIYYKLSENVKISTLLHELSHTVAFLTGTEEKNSIDEEIVAEFTTYLISAKYGLIPDLFNENGKLLLEYVPTLHPETEEELMLFDKAKDRAKLIYTEFFS